jgi:glycoside/pentoside/hexuronide:cation symporter, GPH family
LTTKVTNRNIPIIDKVGYGVGNLSIGIAMQVVGTYLVFFSTVILGIPGYLVGLAVSISIFWDAITDPLMGYLSDITKSKIFGRRHLYLIIGAIGVSATIYLMWTIPASLDTNVKFIILFIYIILFKTFITVYVTPYTALGAELSNDYNERTSIQSIKTIFFLIGLAFVSVAGLYIFFQPTIEFPSGQLNPLSYRNIGIMSAVVVIISTFACYLATKKYIPILNKYQIKEAKGKKLDILVDSLKSTFANRAFRAVALCYLFNNLASAFLSNIGLHVFTYTFVLTSQQIAVILGVQFLMSILSQPVWMYIARKYDKRPAMNIGLLFSVIAGLIFIVLVIFKDSIASQPLYFFPYALIAGFGTGALFTIPLSMVADTIDFDEYKRGLRFEGFYFGSLTLYYKLSQAIAIFFIGILLDLIRFDSSLPTQSEFTLISLGMILALGSIFSFILAYFSLRRYPLNEDRVRHIQAQIRKMQQE